ncbi:cysteine desulfurase DndA [Rhodococcus sp. RDE2]|uniref:cysteine desulfurase DndA n=1 Tax=Rhodococcus sp. RDE2 TaxID=2885078 RepID=UPI001E43FF37|nr:cysteine desulfurase DndA [Rhodococcus sp. RDE2]BDB59762.1 putative L-cysteine desulfurase [Rhodococcus sp. RDE2]
MPSSGPVYLDCNATTPVDPAVLDEVIHFMRDEYGNAGSRTHTYGQRAKERVNRAREEVAAGADAKPEEVIFTSGATESNNLAILGLEEHGRKTGKMHIVTTAIEHKAVLEPIERLVRRGFEATVLKPGHDGRVSADSIIEAIRPDTVLVSVMAANNETGAVQPVDDVARSLADHDTYFHVDAAQAFGKVENVVSNKRIDMISISGHKLYAPKGIGALIVRRRGYRRVPLTPLLVGGGQERGLRPGTLPVPLIAGLGTAVSSAMKDQAARAARVAELRSGLVEALTPLNVRINGSLDNTLASTLNFSVPGVDGEAAILALKDVVAVSNGSACTSQSYEPSHVLKAMDLDDDTIHGAIRVSWSHLSEDPQWGLLAERLSQLVVR